MKKNSLLKVLGICFLAVILLTWVIPGGAYASGEFTKGGYSPIGFLDIVKIPITTLSSYVGYILYILAIGGFYGVLNKTGVYSKLVNKVKGNFKGKEKRFAILTIVFFALLSSITGLNFVLFILVPFFITVMLSLGFTRLSTIMSTIGAILVGNVASTYGFDVCGYLNYYLELNIHNNIFTKIIFFVILVFLLIMFVTKHNMLEKEKSKKDIPLFDEKVTEKTTKSYLPLVVASLFTFIFLLVACYNWSYAINFTGFEELYESIVAVEINGFPVLQNIIGNFSPLGYWNITEITMVIVIASLLIAWLYSLKLSDYMEAFKKGAKEVLLVAFYVALANIIISVILGSTSGTSIYYTLIHYVLNASKHVYNAVVVGAFSAISGLFLNEFPYVVNYTVGALTAVFTNAEIYPLIAFVMQSVFGIMMLVVPTSVLLIAGLSYLKVSYKDWIKYIWKYVLEISVISVIIFAIMSILI